MSESRPSRSLSVTDHPLVSVVIPSYNCAGYVGEAIAGVLSQTYDNYEIIVVDDGSTDDTRKALVPYVDTIKYVYQENRGLPAARNTGIREAAGDLIAFLDADDIWYPTKLEMQVQALNNHPEAGLVFADFIDFDDAGVTGNSRFSTWPGVRAWFDRHRVGDSGMACGPMYVDLLQANWLHASSGVVRRDVVSVVGLFDETCRVGEDYDFWVRTAQRYPVVCVNQVLSGYRIRPQSMSASGGSRGEFALRGKLAVLVKHLENKWIPRELQGLVFREISRHCWGLGWTLFEQNRFDEARSWFVQGVCYRRLDSRQWLYWMATWLPLPAIEAVRRVKQWRRSIRLDTKPVAQNLGVTTPGSERPHQTI